jgi:hypothetical protein
MNYIKTLIVSLVSMAFLMPFCRAMEAEKHQEPTIHLMEFAKTLQLVHKHKNNIEELRTLFNIENPKKNKQLLEKLLRADSIKRNKKIFDELTDIQRRIPNEPAIGMPPSNYDATAIPKREKSKRQYTISTNPHIGMPPL